MKRRSVYDPLYLAPNLRIEPEFGYENVTLRIWFKKVGCEWEPAWELNGGSPNPTIPLKIWESVQHELDRRFRT